MRTNIHLFVFGALLAGLFSLAVPTALLADDVDTMIINVPFNFIVNDTTLPMGRYEVQRALADNMNAWEMRGVESVHSVVFLADLDDGGPTLATHPQYQLIFERIGNENFLTKVWYDGEGFQLPPSPTLLSAQARGGARTSVTIGAVR